MKFNSLTEKIEYYQEMRKKQLKEKQQTDRRTKIVNQVNQSQLKQYLFDRLEFA